MWGGFHLSTLLHALSCGSSVTLGPRPIHRHPFPPRLASRQLHHLAPRPGTAPGSPGEGAQQACYDTTRRTSVGVDVSNLYTVLLLVSIFHL
jgi:hypothetical protein